MQLVDYVYLFMSGCALILLSAINIRLDKISATLQIMRLGIIEKFFEKAVKELCKKEE